MRFMSSGMSVLLACAMLILAPQPANAVPVAIELSLLIDVSGSVDATEYNLQKTGYVNAFNSASIQALIAAAPGGVAVNFIQWSGAAQQQQSVGWTLLTNAAQASAFATAISVISRPFSANTAPGSAINFAVPLFTSNGFEGTKKIIDVSGDGAANEGADTATARNNALAAGINQINGLPILGEAGLLAFYQNNIQGGTGSFTLPAASFADFETAIHNKLTLELGGVVPVPPSAILMGLGGLGFIGSAWRRRRIAAI